MSPQPEGSSARRSPGPSPASEFSAPERALLLKLAHDAIESRLDEREISLDPPSPHLAEARGAFTTLYYQGKLRGCVGYVAPVVSLYVTVVETARGAAFEDSRFLPVTRAEAPELEVSLSILSQLQPMQPGQIEIGRHGLVVSLGACRGLLLPQVPVEHGWDRITFLEQTCRKAGLRLDAWQAGAKIEAFTAEVFGDRC
jgi:uncharacterized protein